MAAMVAGYFVNIMVAQDEWLILMRRAERG
jgi:hypothetical protein